MPLTVELITPERLAFSDEANSVVVPGMDGEIGILPNHAPLLARLGAGEIRLNKDGQTRSLAVSGGFIEVQKGSKVAIFAETAEFADEIDVERAKQAAEKAKQKLYQAQDMSPAEVAQLEASLTRAVLRMKIGQGRSTWKKPPPEGVR